MWREVRGEGKMCREGSEERKASLICVGKVVKELRTCGSPVLYHRGSTCEDDEAIDKKKASIAH